MINKLLYDTAFKWHTPYPAPAKLNLMLRITGQREDGYHLLQTVFQFVTLCDWLTFIPHGTDDVVLENSLLDVADADNLILKAAFLLKKETHCPLGAKIRIEKNLPMGGGIGGGSSDAATTLVVLNHLWQLSLSQQDLMDIGLSLGADIPIFIFGKTAWAEGVGEKLSQINVVEQWVLILKPNCHVNTKEIFCASDLTRNSKSLKIEDFDVRQIRNDCLEVVCKRYEPVKRALEDLNTFADARLTGTGACVFALFDSEASARNAQRELGSKWQTYLTKSCNQSPLFS